MKTNTASLVLAAGRGSRMKGFDGSKTLLPLIPEESPYKGKRPILLEILDNLPSGQKAVVVNHKKEDVIKATEDYDLTYCDQSVLNGTGGALLAARKFLEDLNSEYLIITMGDVPLVRKTTYQGLITDLKDNSLSILGFRPEDKKQYGVLQTENNQVIKIIECKYWKEFTEEKQAELQICNSGIYATKTSKLLHYISVLESRPHIVRKEIGGKLTEVEEYFITDIVEYMCNDGLPVGYVIGNEDEVMGIDDLAAITKAQELFKGTKSGA